MSWIDNLADKLHTLSKAEFDYVETKNIDDASKISLDCSGIYMEASVIYVEIKNLSYILKQNGRRKAAQAYTMINQVLCAIAEQTGAFVNCYSSSAFLVVYPGQDDSIKNAVLGALKISSAIGEDFKSLFNVIPGMEFSMGIDHGHIMGTKNLSDNGIEHISWFGSCILKAARISKECARPFYLGVSGSIYHNLGESLRTTRKRILGIGKNVDIWTKITYYYDNVKKHLYQTNHKISLDDQQ